ncbi:MAG: methyltransferase domain-containing protein [Candidatus Kerfeldbacteria bacterium]|nr:methyltransferase domain-containing protein [Candidatus Kerfeldbacteria bacterium]
MKLAILGNTPELSALELGAKWEGGQVAEVEGELELAKLGGTVKLAEVVGKCARSLAGLEQLLGLLKTVPTDHKLVFGFSVYAADDTVTSAVVKQYAKQLLNTGLAWKKQLRTEDRPVRFVVSEEPALSSVIVHKEHLLRDQTDFVLAVHAKTIVLARTSAVQDYRGFSDRDFGRPQRDHFSGMLPPKVARMMINIAHPKATDTVLDPFCGSGTVVQEALALGFKEVIGSDISKKCIADTKANIEWAKLPAAKLLCCDVLELQNQLPARSIDVVVGEGYLGPVQPDQVTNVHQQLTKFYNAVFPALQPLLKPGARVVLAVPSWKRHNGLLELPLDAAAGQAGFKQFHRPIFYGREQARVVRKILFLEQA